MKSRSILIFACIALILAGILFFPVTSTQVISGNGEVLSSEKVKIGECDLSIEIKEVRSLAVCYSKQFSFTIDGEQFEEFATAAHAEADSLCLITQMYYDEELDCMGICDLVYQEDFSYAVIRWNETLYFVDNGANIPYSALPV